MRDRESVSVLHDRLYLDSRNPHHAAIKYRLDGVPVHLTPKFGIKMWMKRSAV